MADAEEEEGNAVDESDKEVGGGRGAAGETTVTLDISDRVILK